MQEVVVPINYLAVFVAALSSIVVGSVWYGPLFGKDWMKITGMTPEKIAAFKKDPKAMASMQKSYALQFLGSLVMAYVLAHALVFASAYTKTSGLSAGLMAGFWNWLGFVAPVTMAGVLWESKSWKQWCLTNGNMLVTLLVMGSILSLWK